MRVEFVAELLADRVAEHVGLGEREAGERLRHGHDVLLVDHDAVRLLQHRLERGVGVRHRLLAVLAADVRRDVVHRPRAEERDHGHDVLDPVRLQLADVAAHPGGFQLEHAGRFAGAEEVEGLLVVERNVLTPDLDAALFLDEPKRVLEDREVPETEEVELEDPELLELLVLVLRLERVDVPLRALQWDELRDRLARDHDAGGVRARRPHEALDLLREVEEPLHVPLLLEVAELGGHPTRVRESGPERDGLRHAIGLAVRHAEDARDVAHGGTREHRVERADLSHAVGAVLLRHVLDDFVAAVTHEVDVDVRRGEALEVQEPLEDESVLQRVDVGHSDRVIHDRSAGGSAYRGEDPLLVREADEVLHDEDVARVARLRDDRELLVDPLAQLRRDGAVLRDRARFRERAELLLGRLSRRDFEVREAELTQRQAQVDLLGYAQRVLEPLGVVREKVAHLRRRPHEELGVVDHLRFGCRP